MTPLEQKLQQLNLKAMSRQIEATIADAAARNLSVSATIELLADVELESRNGRAIERRFKLSRLQAQASIDAFHFHHHVATASNHGFPGFQLHIYSGSIGTAAVQRLIPFLLRYRCYVPFFRGLIRSISHCRYWDRSPMVLMTGSPPVASLWARARWRSIYCRLRISSYAAAA
jgi:hypothetical protein